MSPLKNVQNPHSYIRLCPLCLACNMLIMFWLKESTSVRGMIPLPSPPHFFHTKLLPCACLRLLLAEWYMWYSTQRRTVPDFPLQSGAAQSVHANLISSVPQLILVPMTTSMCSDTHNLSSFVVKLQWSTVSFPSGKIHSVTVYEDYCVVMLYCTVHLSPGRAFLTELRWDTLFCNQLPMASLFIQLVMMEVVPEQRKDLVSL